MALMTVMRERMHIFLWALLVMFLLSMTVGGLVGGANIIDQLIGKVDPNKAIAQVNGENITPDRFNSIVNQQLEETGQNKNEGYITKFYISPPGDIDYSGSGTQTGYFQIGTANLKNSQTCKVINQSIQTHFVFKVVTREDDMTPVMKPVNV